MNVLLACIGIFSDIGGGQRFYSNLILRNPDIQFYYFGDTEARNIPHNAHAIPISDRYRRSVAEFNLTNLPRDNAADPIRRHGDELALLMDMVSAVPQLHFDIIDIPDFLPLSVYFPECLKYFRIDFGKVALSMHGTLSMALQDNWDEGISGLDSLIEHEELLYRACDLRYGIGFRYVDQWAENMGLPAYLLDVSKVYTITPNTVWEPGSQAGTAPDVCFVGRQEKWKGPDLFIELCSHLPRDAFRRARLLGPRVTLHGNDSLDALRRLALNRSLDIGHEVVPPDRMEGIMRNDRILVIAPSRRDTFNLVALESLLSGCPAIVSEYCGVCDFLDAAYPGLPYTKIDPDNLLASYDEILATLSDYDGARRRLTSYLADVTPNDYGSELYEVYAGEAVPDLAARAVVAKRFTAFTDWLAKGFLAHITETYAANARERCQQVLASYNCTTLDPKKAEQEFRQAVDINNLWARSILAGPDRGNWSVVEDALPRLNSYVFSSNRVNVYRLLAEWERSRGNELLYATYWLRIMRLAGEIPDPVLAEVRAILAANGFSEEANVAAMLDRDDQDEIFRYLSRRAERLREPPKGGIATAREFDRPQSPRVSVIISVYNGAGKVDTFVSGLERFTDSSKSITEFIFVDSASPDNTHDVLTERLQLAAKRGVRSLYLRSEQRETIQRAWNRGIDASRGLYLAFLGVDEMDRPDSLAKMAAFLDRRSDVDWVQGSAVITEVNANGSYVRDVMAYDRRFDKQHIHYLECCYISYVGALYRKSIHDRVGFYDDRFRGAGDTEFKNRVLPFAHALTLPETLGTFLNYPEERTTQSPTAEIEDLRAWYLHRSVGGIRYAFDKRDDGECVEQFHRALNYKKSYMDGGCTDIDYAWNMAEYLRLRRPKAFLEIENFVANLAGLKMAYSRFDRPAFPEACVGMAGFEKLMSGFEHAWFAIAQAWNVHQLLGLTADYRVTNDNRWHQHLVLWPSKPSSPTAARQTTQTSATQTSESGFAIAATMPAGIWGLDTSAAVLSNGSVEHTKPVAANGNGMAAHRAAADISPAAVGDAVASPPTQSRGRRRKSAEEATP